MAGDMKGNISLGFTASKGGSRPQALVLRWRHRALPCKAKTRVLAKKTMHALFGEHFVCFTTQYRDLLDVQTSRS